MDRLALTRQLSFVTLRHLVRAGVPALVDLAGVILVAASPQDPWVAAAQGMTVPRSWLSSPGAVTGMDQFQGGGLRADSEKASPGIERGL